MMENSVQRMPMVALRDMVLLPGMMLHFDISRSFTAYAVQYALERDQMIFLTAQKSPVVEKPRQQDLEEMGTIAVVKQIIRPKEESSRVTVTGIRQGRLKSVHQEEAFLMGDIETFEDSGLEMLSPVENRAMLEGMRDLMDIYCIALGKIPNKALQNLSGIENLGRLMEIVANNVPFTHNQRQEILNQIGGVERYQTILKLLSEEIELFRIKKDFQAKVKEEVDQNQKEYLLREQMKVIREELKEDTVETDAEKFAKRLEKLEASEEIKEEIRCEIDRFKNMSSMAAESSVVRGYLETLLDLPWDRVSEDRDDISYAKKVLDADHYGLSKVKERILEFLSVRSLRNKRELTENITSPILCLMGPPGTGKTSIAQSVADALNKEYVRVCLGGVRDEAEIRGHRRTYVGAMPGKLVDGLKRAKVKNPLMLLDEIDKVGNDYKGDPASALLEVLDAEQNRHFSDHYVELPIDLSQVLFIATANTAETIPAPLLDRMEVIEVSSYTENEKFHIAKEHLIPKVIKNNAMTKKDLTFTKKAVEKMIAAYTREAGVRKLERTIGTVCRKAARQILEGKTPPIRITEKNLSEYLGKEKYSAREANKEPETGIVRGLAWTSAGGETLEVEVNTMSGKGECKLTGKLGDVMKESAQIALTYVRSILSDSEISKDYFETHDIHVHVPEGAVPKDGPSAGVTMATAIYSAVTEKPVRADIAMTGEVTLRGRVLPIGGLKEKLLAAKGAKMKTVLIPSENSRDLEEMELEITEGLEIIPVARMKEVLKQALAISK